MQKYKVAYIMAQTNLLNEFIESPLGLFFARIFPPGTLSLSSLTKSHLDRAKIVA